MDREAQARVAIEAAAGGARVEVLRVGQRVFLLGQVSSPKRVEAVTVVAKQFYEEVYNLLRAPEPRVEVDVRLVETSALGLTTLGFSSAAPVGAVLFFPEELVEVVSLKLAELIQQGEAKVLADPRISSSSGENVAVRIGGARAPEGHAAPEVEVEMAATALNVRNIRLDLKIQVTETMPEGTGGEKGGEGKPRTTKTSVLMTDGSAALLNGFPLRQLTEGGDPVSRPLVVVLTARVAREP